MSVPRQPAHCAASERERGVCYFKRHRPALLLSHSLGSAVPPQICKSSRFPGRVSRPRLSIDQLKQSQPWSAYGQIGGRSAIDMSTTTTTIDPARAAESNTATLVSVLTIFHFLALVFVSLRVYARAIVIKTFGRDDVFMVLSAVRFPSIGNGGWRPILTTTAALCNGRMDRIHHTSAARIGQTPRHNFGGGQHDLLAGRFLPVDYLGHLGARLPQDLDCLQPPSA